MIKVEPERNYGDPIKIGEYIPYENLCIALIQRAQEAGIAVSVEKDEVKIAKGIGGVMVKAEPCIVIYSSEHRKDYFHRIIIEKMQGNRAFLVMYTGGISKNYGNSAVMEGSTGLISNFIGGKLKQKKQEEEMYYDVLNDVIAEAVADCVTI